MVSADAQPGRERSSITSWIDALADRFESEWKTGQAPELADYLDGIPPEQRLPLLRELVAIDLEYSWAKGNRQPLEDYARDWPELRSSGAAAFYDLIRCEWRLRLQRGEAPTPEDYCRRFPDLDPARLQLESVAGHCVAALSERTPSVAVVAPPPAAIPGRLGRYQLGRVVGEGGFGIVYEAWDESMARAVAVKVLRPNLAGSGTQDFLREARNAASLKHPGVVTVHDVGEDAGHCFIVYELIDGSSLKDRLAGRRFTAPETAGLVAAVGEALHHAHLHGLLHRDVKPANVLIDSQGRARVIDFGLGVREEELAGERGRLVGSSFYLPPEVVRGEGHRVDARADVYSLGVVLYEMLCGRRPFRADSREALFDQILHQEPRPPRQIDDAIPPELERICLKAMAKRISDRYTTAADVARELRLAEAGLRPVDLPMVPDQHSAAPASAGEVVPRGLRSFSQEDADSYLRLLPGPRESDGLPESVHFWKQRIESRDPETTFRVGLLYGPSGCGKTSLVRAGLLPRLSESVRVVYLEALRHGTEDRLRAGLTRVCPEVAGEPAPIAALRRGQGLPGDGKVLIVLDQFEQWLQGRSGATALDSLDQWLEGRNLAPNDLVAALRHADGLHVQFLLMVRDDFWLGTARLFQEIEVLLVEGQNLRVVDCFDVRHARHVLEAFGQAYDCLPRHVDKFSGTAEAFLDQAVSGLGRDGRVMPVQLSLFAELMKARPWTPATLHAVGGAEGIGSAFLEETFAGRSANPEHRCHAAPARAILARLLPDDGSDVKGRMRSRAELRASCGLEKDGRRFDRLLDVLNRELRLITAVELAAAASSVGEYYQLAHDYLVPSVRRWLYQKNLETWRGRAALCLDARAAQWCARPETRNLPSLTEYVSIAFGVPDRDRDVGQRRMMRVATRRRGVVAAVLGLALALIGGAAWEIHGWLRARGLVQAISSATLPEAGKLVDVDLPPYRRWAEPSLRALAADPATSAQTRLRVSLACLPDQVDFLGERLLDCSAEDFAVLCVMLRPYSAPLLDRLRYVLRDSAASARSRFHAGMALALYEPDGDWSDVDAAFLARQFMMVGPDEWSHLFPFARAIGGRLLPYLRELFHDRAHGQVAAMALRALAADNPALLAELACEASAEQYHILLPAVTEPASARGEVVAKLLELAHASAATAAAEGERIQSGKARAGAIVTLLHLDERRRALDALTCRDDPEVRTQFIHGLKERGIGADVLLDSLETVREESARFAILLALGEFRMDEIAEPLRAPLIQALQGEYRDSGRGGLHGATGWLLRSWHQELPPLPAAQNGQWLVRQVGPEAMTFVVVGPGEFQVGSPECETFRVRDEGRHRVTISCPVAVADREVTRGLWARFLRATADDRTASGAIAEPELPATDVSWYEAVAFCRWLTTQAGLADADQCYQGSGKSWEFHPDRPGFRLPTEAEWEAACRGGTITPYSFGSDVALLGHYAWVLDNSGRVPQPVATRRPNPLGLFDVHGNAWEWCHDGYGPYQSDACDPAGDPRASTRLYRGGSFDNYPRHSRSACRINDQPDGHFPYVGLRVVYTLAQ